MIDAKTNIEYEGREIYDVGGVRVEQKTENEVAVEHMAALTNEEKNLSPSRRYSDILYESTKKLVDKEHKSGSEWTALNSLLDKYDKLMGISKKTGMVFQKANPLVDAGEDLYG